MRTTPNDHRRPSPPGAAPLRGAEKVTTRMLWTLAGAALLSAPSPFAIAQPDQGIVLPLSDPARPATLEVSVFRGSISVTAHERSEIVIVARDEDDEEDDDERYVRDGLRRIPDATMGLTVEEQDNVVSIGVAPRNREIELEISVPRSTSVRARTVNDGDLRVEGVSGEHELTSVHGDILGVDVAGSAVAGTTNGDIEISFTELTPDKAMSFTSFNGDVDVTFPGSLAAGLRINAGRGEAFTDFDIRLQPRSPVVDRSNDGRRVKLEPELRAVVGGGGPEIYFKTFNGDIAIRRR